MFVFFPKPAEYKRTLFRTIKKELTKWPSNITSRHILWGNQNWKRHMYLNFHCSTIYNSFPVGLVVKSPPANAGDMRPGSAPWVGKIPWRTAWQSSPVFLPGESHGQRSLAGYNSWGCKESDMTEQHTCTFTHINMLYYIYIFIYTHEYSIR